MVNAVLFGAGAALILSQLTANAPTLLPTDIVASFVLAGPLAWLIAPKLSFSLSGRDLKSSRPLARAR